MIGMSFISFIILLAISVVVAGILHFGFKYYVSAGWWSYASKVIVGWIGGWLGSPVFGHWPARFAIQYDNVYVIPAILGSAALIVIAVDIVKMQSGHRAA